MNIGGVLSVECASYNPFTGEGCRNTFYHNVNDPNRSIYCPQCVMAQEAERVLGQLRLMSEFTPKDDDVCPDCGSGWQFHDFGVPKPECP